MSLEIPLLILSTAAIVLLGALLWRLRSGLPQGPEGELDALRQEKQQWHTERELSRQREEALQRNLEAKVRLEADLSARMESLQADLATRQAERQALQERSDELRGEIASLKQEKELARQALEEMQRDRARLQAEGQAQEETLQALKEEFQQLRHRLEQGTQENLSLNRQVSELQAVRSGLQEKLGSQKSEMDDIRKQFQAEFQVMANKILEEKSTKFTELNRSNLEVLLRPLGENIEKFKQKVEEVYDKEAKERFSLGREVEKLVTLNQRISEDANNLTRALKGSSKAQGDWGQVILENILEKSGLVKGREYLVQEFLRDSAGNTLKNEDGAKMQPDVIVNYPDERKVIIDSKVSLTAYIRYTESEDPEEQKIALAEHIRSVRKHFDELSRKAYQDFTQSLDFVMMFIPNEPAYMLAMKEEPELWQQAYDKRILVISPTNLIAALRLIADLWKREHQNRNALDIADRGGKLYDKLVTFVESFSGVGESLDKAQKTYLLALGQLKEGRGNLIGQAEKLRQLGVKTRKQLPDSVLDEALDSTWEQPTLFHAETGNHDAEK